MSDRPQPAGLAALVAILLGIAAPTAGLIAWIALAGPDRADYLRNGAVRLGLGIIGLTALPLLAVGAAASLGLTADPNPNPIGFGLLFFAGAVVGTIVLAVGVFNVRATHNRR